MSLRKTIAVLIAVVPVFTATAMADTLDKIKSSGTFTIAFDPGVPPWSFKDDKLNYAGYEFKTASKFAADHNWTLKIVETNGANRIPLLMTGQVDAVWSAMSITDERRKVINFSVPYAGTQTAVSGPADIEITKPEDLVGKSIAVARGTIMDNQLTALAPGGTDIVRFEDEATTLTSILSGQLQLVAQSTSLNHTIEKRDPKIVLQPKIVLGTSFHGVGMRKEDEALKKVIDEWLLANMKDGTMQMLFEEAHSVPMPEFVTKEIIGQ